MILEGFVSQTQAIDALSNSFLDSVIDQIRVSMIAEAKGKSGNDSRPTLDCAKKSFIRIRSDRSAIKSRDDIAPAQLVKFRGIGLTICLPGFASVCVLFFLSSKGLTPKETPVFEYAVRIAGEIFL